MNRPRRLRSAVRRCAVGAALAIACSPVVAQESIYRREQAVSGQTLQLGVYGNVRQDCTSGPPPDIRVVSPPRTGSLIVRKAKGKVNSAGRCTNVETTVSAVLYQSKPNAEGDDDLTYEVKLPNGDVATHNVKLKIAAPPTKPALKEKSLQEL